MKISVAIKNIAVLLIIIVLGYYAVMFVKKNFFDGFEVSALNTKDIKEPDTIDRVKEGIENPQTYIYSPKVPSPLREAESTYPAVFNTVVSLNTELPFDTSFMSEKITVKSIDEY